MHKEYRMCDISQKTNVVDHINLSFSIVQCKGKQQQLLTCKVNSYWNLASQYIMRVLQSLALSQTVLQATSQKTFTRTLGKDKCCRWHDKKQLVNAASGPVHGGVLQAHNTSRFLSHSSCNDFRDMPSEQSGFVHAGLVHFFTSQQFIFRQSFVPLQLR